MQLYKVKKLAKLATLSAFFFPAGLYCLDMTLIDGETLQDRLPPSSALGTRSNWWSSLTSSAFAAAIGLMLTLRTLQRLVIDVKGEPLAQRFRDFQVLRHPPLSGIAIFLMLAWLPTRMIVLAIALYFGAS